MSKEEVYAFLDRAPISLETKDYIKKHLRDVPNSAAHLDVLTTSPQVGLCVMLGKTVGPDGMLPYLQFCSLDQEAAMASYLETSFTCMLAGVFHSNGFPRVADQAGAPRRESSAHGGAPAHWQDGRFAA